jgi:hypothetical protein
LVFIDSAADWVAAVVVVVVVVALLVWRESPTASVRSRRRFSGRIIVPDINRRRWRSAKESGLLVTAMGAFTGVAVCAGVTKETVAAFASFAEDLLRDGEWLQSRWETADELFRRRDDGATSTCRQLPI